jgi:hypothetical protein
MWTTLGPALLQAQALTLPAAPGQSLALAPDDWRLELQQARTWQLQAQPGQQVVLNFRVRIDNPSTIGSTNMLAIELNGQTVGLKTPRRQMRLLNKPSKFPWSDPPFLNWFIPPSQWRLAYAPDFEILTKLPYYNAESYHFALDVSDLIKAGENTLVFTQTGNKDVARNAKSDLTLVFRDLRLEVREGPGVLPGEPPRPPRFRPFDCTAKRSAPLRVTDGNGRLFAVRSGAREYIVNSSFAGPEVAPGQCQWRHERQMKTESALGRVLVTDRFTNLSDQPVGIRVQHEIKLTEGRCERVNFGGREEPNLEELNRPECPYLFLPHGGAGVGIVAYDDVLRMHGMMYYDDERQAGGIRDDWFGLPPKGEYTMTWAVYTTATENVFDLVNLIRRDWGVSFRIDGGINFFEPDAILAYDDAKLKEHLERLNINLSMSQGGWYDRKLVAAGKRNVGHGPIVAGDFYADYRLRLQAACEKLRRLRPGMKCLIYYDAWLVSGAGIAEHFAASFYTRADGRPRMYQEKSAFDFPIANVVPTLDNTMGRETLAKIPPMILDEIGADGLYWDEIGHGFQGKADYAHPDPHTWVTDASGKLRNVGAPDLAAQPFKLAFMKAFLDRGAMIVGNSPPTNITEQKIHFTRFTETDIPHHPGLVTKTWLYTPVSYAGWSTYHLPNVAEKDFLADVKEKLWNANLYLFSAPMFYHLFTQENLATYQYPITVTGLDEGVIIGNERIITLRPGRFGWPGRKWRGELLRFDAEQKIVQRRRVTPGKDGCVTVELREGEAAVVVCDQ